jgi:ribosome-associated toxin RatA of RatAB toxin-antitoxin module
MALGGERLAEIGAPIERCYAIAADIERAVQWQPALTDVDVLTRDSEGRPATVDTAFDARVRALRTQLRFAYDPPASITWEQERGDVKSLRGWWRFEDLGDGRTRATYGLAVDPGRMLGLLVRGPTEAKVRDYLLGGAVDGLKARAESS